MLQPIIHHLNAQRIVLASGSPRRKQILENIGLKFEVIPSTAEENVDKTKCPTPADYVKETAHLKATEVASRLSKDQRVPDLIIAADTVVAMDNKIYEKPKDRDDAIRMLKEFNGGRHSVHTGVVLVSPLNSTNITSGVVCNGFRMNILHETTDVMMTEMSDDVITSYVDTGEPMDKAGGYGIQAIGGSLVAGVNGDYYNVMGFPLHKFSKTLYHLYQKTS